MVGYRGAYGRSTESRYHQERIRAENERRRAVANRCTGRRKSTVKNPLPHVWQGVGADVMGCKHCPAVRQLTNAEYRAKYGVDRPAPREQRRGSGPVWLTPSVALVAGLAAWAWWSAPVGVLAAVAVFALLAVLP